jgi:hypothetical protein
VLKAKEKALGNEPGSITPFNPSYHDRKYADFPEAGYSFRTERNRELSGQLVGGDKAISEGESNEND